MSTDYMRLLIAVLSFIVIFVTGYMLGHGGKPYSVLLTTIHKLVSVGFIVFLVITLLKINKIMPLTTGDIIVLGAAGLFFVGLLVTGGLLTAEKEMPSIVTLLHKVLPYLSAICAAVFVYMQVKRD